MSQDHESKPFLDGSDAGGESQPNVFRRQRTGTRCTLTMSLLLNFVLLVVCTGMSGSLFLLLKVRAGSATPWDGAVVDTYSPANGIIEYEYRTMVGNDTRFTGHPSQVWEDAMHGLMEGTLFRVSQEELDLHGSDSIAFKDGGFAAGLGVAHNLHCVKKIKQFLYREHFFPDLDPAGGEFEYLQAHADHCLDFLRQSILCNLDYSMYTVYWGERRQDIPTHQMPGKQKCVNWDKLHSWMLGRAASVDDLVRP